MEFCLRIDNTIVSWSIVLSEICELNQVRGCSLISILAEIYELLTTSYAATCTSVEKTDTTCMWDIQYSACTTHNIVRKCELSLTHVATCRLVVSCRYI